MNIIIGAILGFVQGLSEFLPISSSGHLNLVQALFHVDIPHQLFFNIMLHVGTLLAVAIVFWKDWLHMLRHPIKDPTLLLLFVASLPALAGKILFDDQLAYVETHNTLLGVCFLLTGAFLLATQRLGQRQLSRHYGSEKVGFGHALCMGVLQAFGMLPGISRSGSTIFGGVASGLTRETAAKFSFMMSAPAIVAGALSEGYTVMKEGVSIGNSLPAMLVGMVVAAVSGYFAIRFFLKIISKASLQWFALYMALIGLLTIVLQITSVIA